ncbi:MAG: heavy metal translocating P-type ATPase metal-binding domain-containing protein, partial [Bacteroidetes bacterium]|nr:heavy metal translocating P-type ATPase metal-binding domain-containing protein [Bacteroidota bacterium]
MNPSTLGDNIIEVAENCYHCGEQFNEEKILFSNKTFCCEGCKLVYELLDENNLGSYYDFNQSPGKTRKEKDSTPRFEYLQEPEIKEKLIDFTDGRLTSVTLFIPAIHCSSCIWLLENLYRLNKSIKSSRVNFLKREAYITFYEESFSLKELAELLHAIGYEPHISLDGMEKSKEKSSHKKVYYKIGVAGFCFGNIMLLSFPEYFSPELDQEFKHLFGYFNLILSLPVFFYSSSEFFVSAWNGLKQKFINIDVPIVLGIVVMFGRSLLEIVSGSGPGYMDSLAGLIFFMLIGRMFQNKTYDSMSFERDYKSYFPVSVTHVKDGLEKNIPLSKLQKGNHIIIRNQEIIPADAKLIKGHARIDYSFVTGESVEVGVKAGEIIYAGGKQAGSIIELEVAKEVSQSYLTRLWNNEAFVKEKDDRFNMLINKISKQFTIAVIFIALASAFFWWNDMHRALNAFTAVLIITCPCALALSTPFTLGNMLRVFGREKFYLKSAATIETIAKADTIVMDKTGTITRAGSSAVSFQGQELNIAEQCLVKSLVAQSSHPLSKAILKSLGEGAQSEADGFIEETGKGIEAVINGNSIKAGSATFVGLQESAKQEGAANVFISINNEIRGRFLIKNSYREGLENLVSQLQKDYRLALISGDNDAEREHLESVFPEGTT